jgi:hypothetical protein
MTLHDSCAVGYRFDPHSATRQPLGLDEGASSLWRSVHSRPPGIYLLLVLVAV